ncbi:hypothetical protein D3C80_1914790 [compost metagenome]
MRPLKILNEITALQAVIEFAVKCPMGQHKFQIRQLTVNIARPLFDLTIMQVQQLILQLAPRHAV